MQLPWHAGAPWSRRRRHRRSCPEQTGSSPGHGLAPHVSPFPHGRASSHRSPRGTPQDFLVASSIHHAKRMHMALQSTQCRVPTMETEGYMYGSAEREREGVRINVISSQVHDQPTLTQSDRTGQNHTDHAPPQTSSLSGESGRRHRLGMHCPDCSGGRVAHSSYNRRGTDSQRRRAGCGCSHETGRARAGI